MEILIVGGTGVLSSAVVNEALKRGYHVTMINRGNRRSSIPMEAELIQSDKNDYEKISNCIRGRRFDSVIDFLCLSDYETELSFNFYSQYADQYFFISSCAVYDTSKPGICDEDYPKNLKIWDYSGRKWESEKKLMELAKNSQTKVTIIRPCVTYDDTRIPYGITPLYGYHWTMISRIKAGKPIITWNGGNNKCNMTRVEDFAVGVVGLINNPRAYGEAFNVCGDETPSFRDVLDVIASYIHCDVKTIDLPSDFYAKHLPNRAGEILGGRSLDSVNSNYKLKQVVPEFKQSIDIKNGIIMTLKAYEEKGFQKGIDWQFEGDCDRIIRMWCKKSRIYTKDMNLHFVDYFGNATRKNKEEYFFALYFDRVYYTIRKGLSNFKRKLKK